MNFKIPLAKAEIKTFKTYTMKPYYAIALVSLLAEAVLETDGVRVTSQGVRFADVYPAADGMRTFAVMRVRAVTEEIET